MPTNEPIKMKVKTQTDKKIIIFKVADYLNDMEKKNNKDLTPHELGIFIDPRLAVGTKPWFDRY